MAGLLPKAMRVPTPLKDERGFEDPRTELESGKLFRGVELLPLAMPLRLRGKMGAALENDADALKGEPPNNGVLVEGGTRTLRSGVDLLRSASGICTSSHD